MKSRRPMLPQPEQGIARNACWKAVRAGNVEAIADPAGDADWPWQGQIEMLSFANMGAATIFWTVALTASLIATVAGVYFARTDWRDIS
jgi:hypothetical protein